MNDFSDFIDEFFSSFKELSKNFFTTLSSISTCENKKSAINDLFRFAHSIKGMAATMGFENMEKITHRLEDMLGILRDGEMQLSESVLEVLTNGYVIITSIGEMIENDGDDTSYSSEEIDSFIDMVSTITGKKAKGFNSNPDSKQSESHLKDIEGMYNTYDNIEVIKVNIEDNGFRCVRAFIIIREVMSRMNILLSVPDYAILEKGEVDFDTMYIFVENIRDYSNLEKTILSMFDITAVEFIKTSNYDYFIQNVYSKKGTEKYKEIQQEISSVSEEEKEGLYHDIIEVSYKIEALLYEPELQANKIDFMLENFELLCEYSEYSGYEDMKKISEKNRILISMIKDGKINLDEDLVDLTLDTMVYIRKFVESFEGKLSVLVRKQIEKHIEKMDMIKNSSRLEPLSGELLKRELKLSDSDIEDLLKLQKEKYPELKIGEIAVMEKKAATKDVLNVLRKQNDAKKETSNKTDAYEYIKISSVKADELLDIIEDILSSHSRINLEIKRETLKNNSIISEIGRLEGKIKEIQNISISFRMVPLRMVFQNLRMTLKDTMKKLNKNAKFEIKGEDTEIDRIIANKLFEPLMHILKNALSHGIESEKERLEMGKSGEGKIKVNIYYEGGYVFIDIEDDGKGIDANKILKKAIEKGLVDSKRDYTEKEIIDFIFLPGFSTTEEVNEISGRGVGMDVVKTELSRLGGKVLIDTKVGRGTIFKIKVPKNMTALNGTVVSIEKQHYIIPTFYIKEIYPIEEKNLIYQGGKLNCILFRGHVLSIIKNDFVYTSNLNPRLYIILENDGKLKALNVDEVVEKREVVVKPVGEELKEIKEIYGVSVLEDGNPAIILNIDELFKN